MHYVIRRSELRTEKQVKAMLRKMKRFEKQGKILDEMNGEILALEYVLEKRDNLF